MLCASEPVLFVKQLPKIVIDHTKNGNRTLMPVILKSQAFSVCMVWLTRHEKLEMACILL
jgi:hypothetical protein